MHYNKIRKMDISNGPGVRVSIFFQGCHFHCEECFNQETWDFNGGKEFNEEVINHVLTLCDQDYIVGLSILGGEPMHPKNIDGVTELCQKFKAKFPHKTIWAWTGFLFDEYLKDKNITQYLDVLVDGRFEKDKSDPTLKYKGSSNQRVIDVQKSIKNNKVELYCEDV